MRLIEIDGIDLGGLRRHTRQRGATTGRNRNERQSDPQPERRKIGLRILPDLSVNQTTEPKRKQPVPNRRFALASAVLNRVRDQLRSHTPSESQSDQDIVRALQFCDSGRKPVWNFDVGAISNLGDAGLAVTTLSRGSRKGVNDTRHDEASMSAYSRQIAADTSWPVEATRRMNRMYRRQRHFYDVTRRYYLLSRDQLIDDLRPTDGAAVLEIGCGTGRNLIRAASRYPYARFFGIDVSTEMLTSAIAGISRRDLTSRIRVAHGDGTAFDSLALFGIAAFDDIMISYSLSMIADWRGVLQAAASRLKPGGRLHIVDFGRQERLPGLARTLLVRWLTLFDGTPRDELEAALSAMAVRSGAALKFKRPFRGYAQHAVVTFPPGPPKP